jgi:hypothetical protein
VVQTVEHEKALASEAGWRAVKTRTIRMQNATFFISDLLSRNYPSGRYGV